MRWFMRACGILSATVLVSAALAQSPPAQNPPAGSGKKQDSGNTANTYANFVEALGNNLVIDASPSLLNWSKLLGVDFTTVDAPLRAQLKLNDGEGYVVVGLNPDAAADTGLQVFDVVVGLDGEPKQDAAYPVTVWRAGAKHAYTLTAKPAKQFWIGVNLGEIDAALRSQLSLPEGRGLIVQEITEKGPAQQAGLQKFDVIVGRGDGASPGTVEEFSRLIQKGKGETISLQILRHAKSMTVNVTPVERPKDQAALTAEQAHRYFTWLANPRINANIYEPSARTEIFAAETALDRAFRSQIVFTQPYYLNRTSTLRATVSTADDKNAKLAAVEKHLDQLLKELQAARQSLDEIRKLSEATKEKPAAEKK